MQDIPAKYNLEDLQVMISANFTEQNLTLDNLLKEMQGIAEALKNINEKLDENI